MQTRFIKLFLRLSISAAFLSAVADRFGWWGEKYSVWGNWTSFIEYTRQLTPWLPEALVTPAAIFATVAEVIFAICLLVGFKVELVAKLSGVLLLIFALAMISSIGIKAALDYSVFTAAVGAFALSQMKEKYMELDA